MTPEMQALQREPAPQKARRRFKKQVEIRAAICVACRRCVDVCASAAMFMIPFEELTPKRWQDWDLERRVEPGRCGFPAAFVAAGGVALAVNDDACNRCGSCQQVCISGACKLVAKLPAEKARVAI